jgi:hypothetical protein
VTADDDAKRLARNEYMRRYRNAQRRANGIPQRTRPTCGTHLAYLAHRRRNEPACPACRQAWADYQRQRYRDRTRKNPTD